MKATKQVQRVRTPLHQQLLVLIPMIKALEDQREAQADAMPPLVVNVEYHRCGTLTLELNKAAANDAGRIQPDLTLHQSTESNPPLRKDAKINKVKGTIDCTHNRRENGMNLQFAKIVHPVN